MEKIVIEVTEKELAMIMVALVFRKREREWSTIPNVKIINFYHELILKCKVVMFKHKRGRE